MQIQRLQPTKLIPLSIVIIRQISRIYIRKYVITNRLKLIISSNEAGKINTLSP